MFVSLILIVYNEINGILFVGVVIVIHKRKTKRRKLELKSSIKKRKKELRLSKINKKRNKEKQISVDALDGNPDQTNIDVFRPIAISGNIRGLNLFRKYEAVKKNAAHSWTRFTMPKIFSIEDNRDETLFFFERVLKFRDGAKDGDRIHLNSVAVEKVTASTLMYLIAVIFDSKSRICDIGGNYPQDADADRFFEKCGFKKFIKNMHDEIVPQKSEIKIVTGIDVKPEIVAQVCRFVKENTEGIDITDLYAVLIELMSNTFNHAYDEFDKLEKKWFLYAEKKDDVINFVFLDTGKGLPKTVAMNHYEKMQKYVPFWKLDEAELINSALKGEFRTETGKANRGQGLPQVNSFFLSSIVVTASVYSGRGICKLNNDLDGMYELNNANRELYGTLYEWSIKRRNNYE